MLLHSVNAQEIVGFSPEAWMKNESGLLSGRVNFSVKTERGNGNEGYIDFDTDVTYRRKIDRFRMTGELENDSKVDEITGETRNTKDKWLLNGSYNYFLNKKRIWEPQCLLNIILLPILIPERLQVHWLDTNFLSQDHLTSRQKLV